MSVTEPTTIGLSEKAHGLVSQMKEDKHVAELADGYRLGIAIAISRGMLDPPEAGTPRKTVFSTATIDPDGDISIAIRSFVDLEGGSVYKMAERLADWGILELAKQFDGGAIDVTALISQAQPKAPGSA